MDLGLASATHLARSIADRDISAVELLDLYLARADELNGPVNAIVTFDVERARKSAEAADAQTASGEPLGALHGLPITIKDAITTEGIRSTGGATELADHVPEADAPVVERVKAAGAVVFGKTNLPRWSGDIQAYNPMFGTTNNPWDLERTPGGSSGGASAAVAAGLTAFEIGTDIGGSVRIPSHFAGVCGHKPSWGIVPQRGYLDRPVGGTTEADVNVFGPIARSVDDLELVLDVIAGPTDDRATAWKLELPPARHTEIGDFRVAAWLDDPRCPVGENVATLLDSAVRSLESAGVSVDRSARPGPTIDDAWETGLPLISAATSPGRSEKEWEEQVRRANDPDLDPTARMRYQASTLYHRDQLLLDQRRIELCAQWADFFTRHDIMLCPVVVTEAIRHVHEGGLYSRSIEIDGMERSYADLIAWTSFIGFVRLPSTVVPVGLTPDGLPVGIQIVAPFLEDRTALAFARHVERLLGGVQTPPMAVLGS